MSAITTTSMILPMVRAMTSLLFRFSTNRAALDDGMRGPARSTQDVGA